MDARDLDALTLAHCSTLTANVSQLIEHSSESKALNDLIAKLIQNGIIRTTSNASDADSFITSRQLIYAGLDDLYPMYFGDTSLIERIPILARNNFSMTSLLRRDIFDLDTPSLIPPGNHALAEDHRVLQRRSKDLIKIIGMNEDIAVTKHSIGSRANCGQISSAELSAAGRYFSARYFDHYKFHSMSVAPTGVGGTGFLDDLELFPYYDLPIIVRSVEALGWRDFALSAVTWRDQLHELYGGPIHRNFVHTFNAFIRASYEQVLAQRNLKHLDHDTATSYRQMTVNAVCSALHGINTKSAPTKLLEFFDCALSKMRLAARTTSDKNGHFRKVWEEMITPNALKTILVLTATDKEDKAFHAPVKNAGYKYAAMEAAGDSVASIYLASENFRLVKVRSSAGSTGTGGAELTTSDAIKKFDPSYVISVGICFGMKQKSQTIGEVLVSEKLTEYETTRVGRAETRERGVRAPASSKLLGISRHLVMQYDENTLKVSHGEIISGQKLVDSASFLADLKRRFPDAIGGEMEGTGIVAAASRLRKDWLIIKAICDWGKGKGDGDQDLAAANAFSHAFLLIDAAFEVANESNH